MLHRDLIMKYSLSLLEGKSPKLAAFGNASELTALNEIIYATWRFENYLSEKDPELEKLLDLLSKKQIAASTFKQQFHFPWPL